MEVRFRGKQRTPHVWALGNGQTKLAVERRSERQIYDEYGWKKCEKKPKYTHTPIYGKHKITQKTAATSQHEKV